LELLVRGVIHDRVSLASPFSSAIHFMGEDKFDGVLEGLGVFLSSKENLTVSPKVLVLAAVFLKKLLYPENAGLSVFVAIEQRERPCEYALRVAQFGVVTVKGFGMKRSEKQHKE
jgi:hypothetical protein